MGHPLDKATLDRLVLDHLPQALMFATRLTGDTQAAEEIVQEAFARVAARWRSFRGQSQFRTWLFRIVINVFRDELASRKRAEELPEQFAEPHSIEPSDVVAAKELGQLIARRVSSLPARQREVLVLTAYEGLTAAEVAAMLETSVANIYSTLHAARRRLRRDLAPYLAEKP